MSRKDGIRAVFSLYTDVALCGCSIIGERSRASALRSSGQLIPRCFCFYHSRSEKIEGV